MRIDLSLTLPRDAATIAMARHITTCALEEVGAATRTVDEVALALSEACANVVEHAGADDEYEVRLHLTDAVCEIEVVDSGGAIDLGDIDVDPGMPASPAGHGRGIALMRALVDEINFVSQPDRGTAVCLVKRLDLDPGATRAAVKPIPRSA